MEHVQLKLLLEFFKSNLCQTNENTMKQLIFKKIDIDELKNTNESATIQNLLYFLNKCLSDSDLLLFILC